MKNHFWQVTDYSVAAEKIVFHVETTPHLLFRVATPGNRIMLGALMSHDSIEVVGDLEFFGRMVPVDEMSYIKGIGLWITDGTDLYLIDETKFAEYGLHLEVLPEM